MSFNSSGRLLCERVFEYFLNGFSSPNSITFNSTSSPYRTTSSNEFGNNFLKFVSCFFDIEN